MIKVAFINNATAEDVSRKYQGWTHTAYISFIHFPLYFVWFMFTLPAAGTQLPNADCSMHQIVTIIVRRGCCLGLRRPTTDTGWTLKDSNQRPAANLRCRLLRAETPSSTKTKSSSNYFRWARNTHTAQNVQCGGTWSTMLIIFSPVVELVILTLHHIFNTPHPKDWGFFHWSCCAWSIVIHQIRARYIKMSCPNSIITSDLDTRF